MLGANLGLLLYGEVSVMGLSCRGSIGLSCFSTLPLGARGGLRYATFCVLFSLPLGTMGWLRLFIMLLPGLFN